jgi:hypothetical protein
MATDNKSLLISEAKEVIRKPSAIMHCSACKIHSKFQTLGPTLLFLNSYTDYIFILTNNQSWYSSVSRALRPQVGLPRSCGLIPGMMTKES